MLSIQNVTRRFGDNAAVDCCNIDIKEGQMVGIIGKSGAGKSTLLRMINRLVETSEGQITFGGKTVSEVKGHELRRWQSECAMIFQQFNLVPRLDVLTNVLLGRLNHRPSWSSILGLFSKEERARAILALEQLDIAQTAFQKAGTLSGGQQQRVAIARALVQSPKVILADEPIASLDPRNAKIVMDALKTINQRDGLTVVTNLHTLDTARAYCERIIGMQSGKVVFDGTPDQLTTDVARSIYGADGLDDAFSESMTSTSLPGTKDAAQHSDDQIAAAQQAPAKERVPELAN